MLAFATHCFHNVSRAWYRYHELEERDQIYRLFQGWLILPVAIPGLLLSSLLVLALCRVLHRRRPPQHCCKHGRRRVSNKFYVLVLNRSCGDLLACSVSLLIAFYVLLVAPTAAAGGHVDTRVTQLLNIFLLGCFWSSMITYVSIALLKLFGVACPLKYRQHVTTNTCVRIVQINWTLVLATILLSDLLVAMVDIPALSKLSGCVAETCLYLFVHPTRNILTAGTYLCTLGCVLLAVLLIRRARPHSIRLSAHSRSVQSSTRSTPSSTVSQPPKRGTGGGGGKSHQSLPLAPLLTGLLTLAIFHAPSAGHAIYLALFTDKCFYLRHYALMQKWMGIIRHSLLIRVNMDAGLAFAVDRNLQIAIRELFCRRKQPSRNGSGSSAMTNKSCTTISAARTDGA